MVTLYFVFLGLIGAERVVEVALSRRNAAWALARGGVEVSRLLVALHVAAHALFLPACAAEVLLARRPLLPALAAPMLVVALGAQVLRWWSVRSLGHAWNIRVIAVPGAPAVGRGPYRWIRHPNYLAVLAEGAAVPLVYSAWVTAGVFTLVNAVCVALKMRREEALLRALGDYGARLGDRPALLPRAHGRSWRPRGSLRGAS